MSFGIYQIRNLANGKVYIGSTSTKFKERWKCHLSELRRNLHSNQYLQNAWNKYGENGFIFEVVEECSKNDLILREQYFLDKIGSYCKSAGYNICKIAGKPPLISGQVPWNKKPVTKKEYKDDFCKRVSQTLRKNMTGSKTKLNWGTVKEIRELYKNSNMSQSEISRIYDVDRSQICRIIRNQTWVGVKEEVESPNYRELTPEQRENIRAAAIKRENLKKKKRGLTK